MTALVLSAGGLWAAWEVGAWSVLRERFRSDLIVGASAGAWNGWPEPGGHRRGVAARQRGGLVAARPDRHRLVRAVRSGRFLRPCLRFRRGPLDHYRGHR